MGSFGYYSFSDRASIIRNDIITGGFGADSLVGGNGNDVFNVGGTNQQIAADVIAGGAGTNVIKFVTGSAAIVAEFDFDNISDVLTIENTAGDTAQTRTVTFSAIAETTAQTVVLNLASSTAAVGMVNSAASSTTIFNISGGGAADTLIGSLGADTIVAGVGADTITGGGGNDRLTGGDDVDLFRYTTAATSVGALGINVDVITDFISTSDKIQLLAGEGTLLLGVTLTAGVSTTKTMASAVVDATVVGSFADVYTAITAYVQFDATNFTASTAGAGTNQVVAKNISFANGAFAGTYTVINDATAAFSAANDLVIGVGAGVVTVINTDIAYI